MSVMTPANMTSKADEWTRGSRKRTESKVSNNPISGLHEASDSGHKAVDLGLSALRTAVEVLQGI